MTATGAKSVKLLLADDNPLIRELVAKGLEPFCEVEESSDGADALLKVIDAPPDVILCDYKMPGLDGRQLFEKLRAREATKHIPFLFMASRPDIEERLRPLVDGVEDFITKPFLVKDLVRVTKKVVDRLHLEKLQKRASRPGVIQGRLEEMSMTDLLQSLEMGQKSCRLRVQRNGESGELSQMVNAVTQRLEQPSGTTRSTELCCGPKASLRLISMQRTIRSARPRRKILPDC
jgi:CheY-like chemotaxis protein